MEIKRGPNPTYVERTVGIDFTREELLQILSEIATKKTGTAVQFNTLQGVGIDNKLAMLSLVGIEQVPITWTTNKPTATPPVSGEVVTKPAV